LPSQPTLRGSMPSNFLRLGSAPFASQNGHCQRGANIASERSDSSRTPPTRRAIMKPVIRRFSAIQAQRKCIRSLRTWTGRGFRWWTIRPSFAGLLPRPRAPRLRRRQGGWPCGGGEATRYPAWFSCRRFMGWPSQSMDRTASGTSNHHCLEREGFCRICQQRYRKLMRPRPWHSSQGQSLSTAS
jgi:hypothetical protein